MSYITKRAKARNWQAAQAQDVCGHVDAAKSSRTPYTG
jgi:hypothetical protein